MTMPGYVPFLALCARALSVVSLHVARRGGLSLGVHACPPLDVWGVSASAPHSDILTFGGVANPCGCGCGWTG